MPSPSKKRKLDNGSKSSAPPAKGLEYFFNRQKQVSSTRTDTRDDSELTDEELARKLQDEWNNQDSGSSGSKHIQEKSEGGQQSRVSTPSQGSPSKYSQEFICQDANVESPSTAPDIMALPESPKKTLTLQSAGMSEDFVTSTVPLDQSPLTFVPSDYLPQLQGLWASEGGDATYSLLTSCFMLVSRTTSRIKIVDTLVNCLRLLIEGDPSSLLPAVWLATNSISPPYISLELGLGGSAISKALKQVCGLDNRSLKAIYGKYGDAGDVAFEAKKKQSFTLRRPKPLTIKGVYASLVKIANSQGQRSAEVKQRLVDRLLQDARGGEESRFIVRTLCQHLRIGAVKTTMLIALSRAFLLSRPPGSGSVLRSCSDLSRLKKEELAEIWARSEEIVKACFARRPNYNDLVPVLLEIGVTDELLLRCDLTLHVPLRPMLGSITRDLAEMLTKLQGRDFACEYKYDGQRAQIHCDIDGKVSIFSRHLELMTDKYPDLVELVPRIRGDGVDSFIMEGEVVAVDRDTGELRNFQTLSNRARKDVAIDSIAVDVCLFSFDLMFLNGQPLLDRPFRERRELLRSLFIEIPHHFTWVKSMDATSGDSEAVLEFFKSATDAKCEGIMVKILDNLTSAPGDQGVFIKGKEEREEGEKEKEKKREPTIHGKAPGEKKSRRKALLATYEPDRRVDAWLKVKKDYHSSFDTLDMIPIAAWHGNGRKAKWWSPFLMAVRNEETGSLEAVCKCMSGFTDAFYKANRAFYNMASEGNDNNNDEQDEGEDEDGDQAGGKSRNIRTQKPSFVDYSGPEPDVWFEPQEVWEMAFADITLSPTYTAAIGLVSGERGLSLRFPRFMKKREDKSIEEASTNEFLAGLWRKQEAKAVVNQEADGAGDEGDEE